MNHYLLLSNILFFSRAMPSSIELFSQQKEHLISTSTISPSSLINMLHGLKAKNGSLSDTINPVLWNVFYDLLKSAVSRQIPWEYRILWHQCWILAVQLAWPVCCKPWEHLFCVEMHQLYLYYVLSTKYLNAEQLLQWPLPLW